MGGRGSFAKGRQAAYTFKTVGIIEGVKVIQPLNPVNSLKLPEESHSASCYLLLDRDGVFHQYREYNENHQVILEIGYHHESRMGNGDVLHIHVYREPGVEHHENPSTVKRKLTREEYHRYKKLLKGVTIDEREYFG